MKVHQINKQNNISTKALYFPENPSHLNVIDSSIRRAFQNNPYIKRLSEEADIFVRYFNAKNAYYYAKIDIVDIKNKKTKSSMQYSTGFFKDNIPTFSEEEFISNIGQPDVIKPDYKGNLSNKINRLKRTYKEKREYYAFSFLSYKNLRSALWDGKGTPPQLKNTLKLLAKCYRDIDNVNKETMSKIIEEPKA